MRYNLTDAGKTWRLIEPEFKDGKMPFSAALTPIEDNRADLAKVAKQLRLLSAGGPPPPKQAARPLASKFGECKNKQTTFYVLKIKPTTWRLFFFVRPERREDIVVFYAIQKKKWKYPKNIQEKCCGIVSEILNNQVKVYHEIEIPIQ